MDLQCGFQKNAPKSTLLKEWVDIAQGEIKGEKWRFDSNEYCVVITLYIKNAFNSAYCEISVQYGYLMKVIDDYSRDRRVMYQTDDGENKYTVSVGFLQGSVLHTLVGCTIFGLADNIAIVLELGCYLPHTRQRRCR